MKLRGLVTSLGAGGSLIAAALCVLVLVGGILAVSGGGGGGAGAEPGHVVMPGATEIAAAAAPDGFAGSDAVVAHDPAATAGRPRPAARRSAVRRVALRPPAPGGSAPPAATAPEAPSAPSEPAPPSREGRTAEVATVRVVQQARATVAPVVKAAPEPVPPATGDVVDTAEQVAGTVDETLAPSTGPLP